MVGGMVCEIVTCDGRLWVDCLDMTYGREHCAIYVEANDTSRQIRIGDSLWWQGRNAMWTPFLNRGRDESEMRCGVDYDVPIPRIGYSGVPRPVKAADSR